MRDHRRDTAAVRYCRGAWSPGFGQKTFAHVRMPPPVNNLFIIIILF
jgi:hypothetical protein